MDEYYIVDSGGLPCYDKGQRKPPEDVKRPGQEDRIRELVIPFDYVCADWLPRAVQETADLRRFQNASEKENAGERRARKT